MEQNKKKALIIALTLFCLAALISVTYTQLFGSQRSGIESIPADQSLWLKCKNPDCNAEYQIAKREYYTWLQKDAADKTVVPPMTCKECGKKSVYRAVKCKQCGNVFFYGQIRGGFPDRCPECGYSDSEHSRMQPAGK